MLKKLYTLLSLLSLCGLLHAQDFHGGVLAGLATSEISGDRLEGPNKAGLYLGAFVSRHFSMRSSLQLELDFIQKGSRENPDSTNDYHSYLLRLNYVEMPLHYNYDFHPRGTIEGGLSLGVLVHSYELADGYEWVSGGDFDPLDLSFNIGLYYRLLEKLRINVRYSNSILPVRPHAGGATWRLNKGQYNEVLSFVLFLEL
ncbi:MAG: outer membrane beta-barrel protein [Bacteroidales bacterium]